MRGGGGGYDNNIMALGVSYEPLNHDFERDLKPYLSHVRVTDEGPEEMPLRSRVITLCAKGDLLSWHYQNSQFNML